MSEGQSRYGIIEELSKRKINQKEKLANIERDTDQRIYDTEKTIEQLKQQIVNKEGVYKFQHKDYVREREVSLTLLEKDYQRKKAEGEKEISDDNANFEKRFQDWKQSVLADIAGKEVGIERYKEVQDSKIAEKKEIIAEIDKGINDLKEVSSEQGKTPK